MQDYYISLKLMYTMVGMAAGSVLVYAPLYYQQALGFSKSRIGILGGAVPLVSAISSPFWGNVADRTGKHRRIMFWIYLVGSTASCALLQLSIPCIVRNFEDVHQEAIAFGIALFCASGWAFFGGPMSGPLVDAVAMHKLGVHKELYGRQRLFTSVSFGVSVFIIGQLMEATKDANVILYYFGVSAVFQLLVLTFGDLGDKAVLADGAFDERQPEEDGEVESLQTSGQAELSATSRPTHTNGYMALPTTAGPVDLDERTALEWFCHPRVIVFVFTMTCAGVAFSIMNLYLFLFLKEIGSSDSLAGMVGPVGAVTSLLVFAFSKTILLRIGLRTSVICGLLGLCSRLLVLVLGASDFWQRTALIVVWTAWLQGIGFGLMWSAAVPYLSELTPLHLKSTAQGCLYAAFFGVGNAAGSYVGGIVYEHFGARAMFLDAIIILLLGMGVFAVEELVTTRCISSR